jgi:hypothetical protein
MQERYWASLFLSLLLFFTISLVFHSYYLNSWWSTSLKHSECQCMNWKMYHTIITCSQRIFISLIFIKVWLSASSEAKWQYLNYQVDIASIILKSSPWRNVSLWIRIFSKNYCWHFLISLFILLGKNWWFNSILFLSIIVLNSCKSIYKNSQKSWEI